MSIKCYYCGGENDESAIVDNKLQCIFCRRWSSIPTKLDRENQALYALGRQKMDLLLFREAEQCFEKLIVNSPNDGDAYWQALMCHYGVEYIMDEATRLYVPTITLLTKEPILQHSYYIQAIHNAGNDELRSTWQTEAEHINNILLMYEKVASIEQGYDVFISVKQGTDQGTPTNDSFEAARLTQFLEGKGLRVFNSRFCLKDIIGQEYEPYIMAALLSAKAMVVVGSSKEYIESKWVKNEWRRFRWLQENSDAKRVLIPFLLGMSPTEVPVEMGAIQCVVNTSTSPYADILRAIRQTIPLKIQKLTRPLVVPDNLADNEKEAWIEKVRKDLGDLDELRSCVMPDLGTARDAVDYTAIILSNLTKLKGYGEADSLTIQASNLKKHFQSELDRIILNEYATQLDEIENQMNLGITKYADACAIQDSLEKILHEISGYTGQSQTESELKKLNRLLDRIRKTIIRLNPNNIVSDSLRHAIAVGENFVAGLCKNGTVLIEGKNRFLVSEAEQWEDIVSLAAGSHHLVGLRSDGSVVATGSNKKNQCNVNQWNNIISIVACNDHTLALNKEGRCLGVGDDSFGQIGVGAWRDIVSISTTYTYSIGCNRNGRTFSVGDYKQRGAQVSGWTEISRVFAVDNMSVGIRNDGKALCIGSSPQNELLLNTGLNSNKQLYNSFIYYDKKHLLALDGNGECDFIGPEDFRGGLLGLSKNPIRRMKNKFGFFIIASLFVLVDLFLMLYGSERDAPELLRSLFTIIAILFSIGLYIMYSKSLKNITGKVNIKKWNEIIEIDGSISNGIYAVKKDGSVCAEMVKNKPQWYGIGLPEIND